MATAPTPSNGGVVFTLILERVMNIELAREIAAQCWCEEETSECVMDVRLAEAFAKKLVEHTSIEATVNSLTQAMIADPGYAYAWHANIAMSCYDSLDDMCHSDAHRISNEAASRFMKLCFNVETSANLSEYEQAG